MAIEKTLNTRIQLKYDSYANWTTNNPVLKAGEVAIAYLATSNTTTTPDNNTHPVMFKVGPGNFNALPWASALAADVHGWAKKSEDEFTTWVKSLIEVTDINAYSKEEIDQMFTSNSAADQKYAKDYADGLAKNYDAAGTAQGLINDLDVADTAVTGQYVSAVSETDGKISVTRADLPTYTLASGSANGTVAFNGADVAVTGLGSAAFTESKAYDAAGAAATAKTEAIAAAKTETETQVNALRNGAVKDNADAISAIKDHATVDSFADVMAEVVKMQVAGDYATKAEAKEYADAKDAAIATAKASGDKAQEDLAEYIESNDAAVALKASQADLEVEIARAKAAEKANADAIEVLTNGVDQEKVDSVKDLISYVETHGPEVTGMKEDIADNAQAIADEIARAEAEEERLAGLIGDNAEAIQANADAIAALNGVDGKVAAAAKADVASALDEAGIAQVKGIKVDNAAHADSADNATNAAQLGGVAADQYATKAYADQAEADAITAANANTAEVIKNYYTKAEADAEFMNSAETGSAIDAKITALNLAATYEPIGAETRAKAYADGLAGNYEPAGAVKTAQDTLQANIDAVEDKADQAQADVDALEQYVGTFTHDTATTVVEYINAKTASIASDAALTELAGRVTTAEGAIIAEVDRATKAEADLTTAIETAKTEAANQSAVVLAEAQKAVNTHAADTNLHVTAALQNTWNSAVQTVTAAEGSGLKATRTANDVAISFDDSVVFVFDCGSSSKNVD